MITAKMPSSLRKKNPPGKHPFFLSGSTLFSSTVASPILRTLPLPIIEGLFKVKLPGIVVFSEIDRFDPVMSNQLSDSDRTEGMFDPKGSGQQRDCPGQPHK
jgi:hypothetical protein